MNRFWSFQTKFVVVLVLLMLGALVLQSYVHEMNKERLFTQVEALAVNIANDVTSQLASGMSRLSSSSPRVLEGRPSLRRVGAEIWGSGRRGNDSKAEHRHFFLRADPEQIARLVFVGIRTSDRETLALQIQKMIHLLNPDTPAALQKGLMGAASPSVNRELLTLTSPISPVGSYPLSLFDEIDISPHVDGMQDLFDGYRQLDLLATVGIFILGIGVAWFLGVRMTRPVYDLAEGFQGVAEGDLETRVSSKRRDEFGHLARQFNHMVERLQENRDLERSPLPHFG